MNRTKLYFRDCYFC